MKKLFLYVIVAVVFLILLFLYQSKQNVSDQSKILLFYSQQCPHCQHVEKYIQANHIDKKMEISYKPIDTKPGNIKILVKLTKQCGKPTDKILIPLLWTGKKCLVGDSAIIQFLKKNIENK